MFRQRDPQGSLLEIEHLLPSRKRARLTLTWAHQFREHALPLIREELFASMFCADNGRPNFPVQILVGALILKDMFDLTDDELVEQVEFNLLWQHALRLSPDDAHVCAKTLQNFRARLLEHDGGRLAFTDVTDRIIKLLGIRTDRQRLDGTHILSNFAILTRLGLVCETVRVFLAALRRDQRALFNEVPEGLRQRHVKDDGTETRYRDAKSDAARRRLSVCVRDVYRLVARFRGTPASDLPEYSTLTRLLEEQCTIVDQAPPVEPGEDDAADGAAPVVAKEPKEISSASLQTPHDPDVTYSGHKGKGYEVQVAETCHEDNPTEIITHATVTDSCTGDGAATLPVLNDLIDRGLQPSELVADTAYGSAENAVEAETLGTELISPLAGSPTVTVTEPGTEPPLTGGDFKIDPTLEAPARCPADHAALSLTVHPDRPDTIELTFDAALCAACPFAGRCPVKPACR